LLRWALYEQQELCETEFASCIRDYAVTSGSPSLCRQWLTQAERDANTIENLNVSLKVG
jgi:hypothetical protein